jgi:hypothetical protein
MVYIGVPESTCGGHQARQPSALGTVTCTIGVGTEAEGNPEGEPVCTTP